jgi:carbon-monoxide dehydrogenase medium subunit
MHNFAYHIPHSLPEALAILSGYGGTARCLAGGTDLVLAMERGRAKPAHVVDLKGIAELRGITTDGTGAFEIGALTTMGEIESHAGLRRTYPALANAAACVGGPAIRNRATVGGNLCNASPAADTAVPLLACGAELVLAGTGGQRVLPLARFWRGAGQAALAPGEILVSVRLPPRPPRSGTAFQRVTRTAMDIAVVNAAADLALDAGGRVVHLSLALGAVGATVLSVPGLVEELAGKPVDDALLEWVARSAQAAARPRDDVRASAAYRLDQCAVLARRAVLAALRAANGEEARS